MNEIGRLAGLGSPSTRPTPPTARIHSGTSAVDSTELFRHLQQTREEGEVGGRRAVAAQPGRWGVHAGQMGAAAAAAGQEREAAGDSRGTHTK
jgi:hypothetical protein